MEVVGVVVVVMVEKFVISSVIFLFEKNTYSDQSVPISPNFYFRFLMQDHPPPEENTVPRFFMSTAIAMLADKES